MAVGAAGEAKARRAWRKLACVSIIAAVAWPVSGASAADPVVAAAGDIACSSSSSNFNGGLGTADRCRQKYTSDLLVNAGLAAVLPLGDAQYENGTLSGFRSSYDLSWGRVKSITRPAAGNHEYGTANAAGYFDYFNGAGVANGPAGDRTKGYYSFNVGTWHLIALNSTDHCAIISCAVGSAQEQWLKADLAANADKYCTLAFWHDPRFNSGHDGNADEMAPLYQALYNADADVVLGGHAHDYERFAPQNPSGQLDNARGIRQFVVGTGGAFWTSISTPKPNSQVRQNNTYGVLKLTLHPASYDWQFVSESNKPFTDSGTGSCHGGTPPPGGSDTTKPSIPGGLTATASVGQVALNWNASTDNVGVTGYRIYRGGTQIGTVGTTTSYTDTSVAANTAYSYTVRAEDAAGNLSDPSTAATRHDPGSTVLTIAPEADARVETSTPTTNYADRQAAHRRRQYRSRELPAIHGERRRGHGREREAARVRLHRHRRRARRLHGQYDSGARPRSTGTTARRARAPRPTTRVQSRPTPGRVRRHPIRDRKRDLQLRPRQTASDGVDFRSREYTANRPELVVTTAGPDTTKPAPPGSLTATGSHRPGRAELGRRHRQRRGHGLPRLPRDDAGRDPRQRDLLHRRGPRARSYSYTVRALDAAGNVSDPSNTASATVPDTTKPGAPGTLSATGSPGQVALSWGAATDNVGVTGYRVFRGATEVATLGNVTSYTDTGLGAGSYSYTVRALDAAGNVSDPSNTASATVPDTTKPGAPGTLSATGSPGQVALSWGAATDNVGGHGLPGLPRDDAGRDPRQRDLLHGRGPGSGVLQLHGAGARRRREHLRPEQHRERDRARHDQAGRARHAQRHREPRPGRAELGRRHRQRRGHRLPGLPRDDADRDPRQRDVLHGRGPRAR